LGRARIGVGRMDGRLLVAHEDVLDRVLLEDLVVDVEDRAAGIAEDVLDTLFAQAADNDFSAGDFHCVFLSSPGSLPAGASAFPDPCRCRSIATEPSPRRRPWNRTCEIDRTPRPSPREVIRGIRSRHKRDLSSRPRRSKRTLPP